MSNIASALKDEISRHTRKELRRTTEDLKKAATTHRSSIAELNRRIASLEQSVQRMERILEKAAPPPIPVVSDPQTTVRFSGANLRKLRTRLDLSTAVLASILGVSVQTIYNWEGGQTRPRAGQLANILVLRGMSKKDVHARLVGAN